MTAGQGTTANLSYAAQCRWPANYSWFNCGIPAETLETMATNAATHIDGLYDATKDYNICVMFGGTNSIASTVGNETGATAYATLVSYCQARRAVGWKVVVVTMLPRTGNGGSGGLFEVDRTAFNSLVRANWQTFADGLADVGADPVMGNSSTLTNTSYYGSDQIHPTVTGAQIVARYVVKAVNSIVAPSYTVNQPTHF